MDPIDSEISDKKPCIQCGTLIPLNGNFCNNCGAREAGEISSSENKWGLLKQAGLFFAIDIIACALAKFAGVFDAFSWALFFDLLMAVSAIVFLLLTGRKIRGC